MPICQLLDPERRPDGHFSIVLMHNVRAEDGHEAVSHEARDPAPKGFDGFGELFERSIHDLQVDLRIKLERDLRGGNDVQEKDGHLLALKLTWGMILELAQPFAQRG